MESNVQVALVIISLLLILAVYFAVVRGLGVGGEGLTGMRVLEYFWDIVSENIGTIVSTGAEAGEDIVVY